jgi:TPR repeat protein
MNRLIVTVLCCLSFFLFGWAGNGIAGGIQNEEPWTPADQATEDALAAGDYRSAIDVVRKQAEAGNPEMQFWVGYLYLEWLGDPDGKEPPTHQAGEALEWIRKAVSQGSPQAAGVLRSGYEWGRYTLPKNAELETCWRRVENGDQDASVCLAAEEALD